MTKFAFCEIFFLEIFVISFANHKSFNQINLSYLNDVCLKICLIYNYKIMIKAIIHSKHLYLIILALICKDFFLGVIF